MFITHISTPAHESNRVNATVEIHLNRRRRKENPLPWWRRSRKVESRIWCYHVLHTKYLSRIGNACESDDVAVGSAGMIVFILTNPQVVAHPEKTKSAAVVLRLVPGIEPFPVSSYPCLRKSGRRWLIFIFRWCHKMTEATQARATTFIHTYVFVFEGVFWLELQGRLGRTHTEIRSPMNSGGGNRLEHGFHASDTKAVSYESVFWPTCSTTHSWIEAPKYLIHEGKLKGGEKKYLRWHCDSVGERTGRQESGIIFCMPGCYGKQAIDIYLYCLDIHIFLIGEHSCNPGFWRKLWFPVL